MSRSRPAPGLRAGPPTAGLAALALLAAACGGQAAPSQAAAAPPAARPSMLTSLSGGHGAAWAVIEVGGSRAGHDNFWQLLVRTATGGSWRLATPPGVADNGGLVAAGPGGPSAGTAASGEPAGLVAGFVPSQDLTFSPLASSGDGGRHWSSGLLPDGLSAAPSALAAGPDGRLLALAGSGVQLSGPDGTGWSTLASTDALAASPAGRSCGLTGLTAVAFGPDGMPLLAGSCSRPGVTGIFIQSGGQWRLAGLKPPAAFAARPVTVVQLTATAPGKLTALLAAGQARAGTSSVAGVSGAQDLAVAWFGDGQPWTTSAPLPMDGRTLVSTAAGSDGTAGLILSGGRAAVIGRPSSTASTVTATAWTILPALPAGAADLVLGPGRQVSVLAAGRTTVTAWQLSKQAATWSPGQELAIPVPFGSSG